MNVFTNIPFGFGIFLTFQIYYVIMDLKCYADIFCELNDFFDYFSVDFKIRKCEITCHSCEDPCFICSHHVVVLFRWKVFRTLEISMPVYISILTHMHIFHFMKIDFQKLKLLWFADRRIFGDSIYPTKIHKISGVDASIDSIDLMNAWFVPPLFTLERIIQEKRMINKVPLILYVINN